MPDCSEKKNHYHHHIYRFTSSRLNERINTLDGPTACARLLTLEVSYESPVNQRIRVGYS
jgi:hypothetical protein